ncbi:O-antigen polysaccharide polymerase Wzy [Anabaena subtropica]|uniref:O-antigen polysaccharide polymerase Wzy n=1 Tax=Anabaena subtropica FACHB-260 TaxID=2692884 RepID=A0ABR8CQL6_9NOST|nr:O-antigen polysaccharide polymerase Wzy [Anabaena subtropica]MBD2345487.1 O-antigen polysaccharide polymerase Wzy [Anabaena subtropica FACHB-260]
MNQFANSTPQLWAYLPSLPKKEQKQLLRVFWFIALGLVFYELFLVKDTPFLSKLGAVAVTVAALWPNYLWCSGRAKGMPIFPFFALTHIWTYGLPLVTHHPTVLTYSLESQLFASLTVAGFLILGTSVWFSFVKSVPRIPKYYRALTNQKSNAFFFFILIAGVFFNVSIYGKWGWLSILTGGLFTAVRATVLGLNALATFVLSYQLGNKELTKIQGTLFIILVFTYMITNSLGYLLVGASSSFLLAVIAFTISSKKVPIIPIVIVLVCVSLLHYGKGSMRAKYWDTTDYYLQPWEYPTRYAEWIGYSVDYFNKNNQGDNSPTKKEKKESFLERASVIQMLLLAQTKSPDPIPYMYGETYAIIPELLVPRIFNSNKIWSHEGTSLLNIHYKRQTREQTLKTTIGWGLLAESYANFGLIGCGGLAIVLGAIYGKVSRWSINAPILSVQSLFAVIMMSFAFQSEFSAGVYVAALYQSSIILVGIAFFLMKKQRPPNYSFPRGKMA